MRRFRWLLNWSIQDIYTNDGDAIPVWCAGKQTGTCTILIEGNSIIGDFSLNEELPSDYYLLYTISEPDMAGQRWLTGLSIVPPFLNAKNRARTIDEMNTERAV